MHIKDYIRELLTSGPFNISAVEKEAKLPTRTIHNWLKNLQDLPQKHLVSLLTISLKYGLRVGDAHHAYLEGDMLILEYRERTSLGIDDIPIDKVRIRRLPWFEWQNSPDL
ncbi:hypothetical protein [Eisenibacter elegans]|jgi:hypothetical protein|uniref:hypothetical protein n=1 Tax=Eisenibacter elegans TaxID=997 RepID=UPI000412D78A|nr:hypothetical protein [Eisenibacter elegans]